VLGKHVVSSPKYAPPSETQFDDDSIIQIFSVQHEPVGVGVDWHATSKQFVSSPMYTPPLFAQFSTVPQEHSPLTQHAPDTVGPHVASLHLEPSPPYEPEKSSHPVSGISMQRKPSFIQQKPVISGVHGSEMQVVPTPSYSPSIDRQSDRLTFS
jgi:hypothetical protein